ncbi:prephenate dehydrogenase [Kurthia sibirica]|uniref:Prephenate dehydrogenase n=1 Tax=Kurthia sibirica TaxID=202750 RepID=A0A2U3AIT4_9BACL|nr:prephenate dehydrogenase [Kurthia sibirica]PWI24445.1 prephenate dehydrogenase [Kurthia sibirica]GEK35169.1 prephenate dehydrogenase [Kurthia sibirica]
MKNRVLVVGLGLIGGSIALALQKSPDNEIIGFDANADTLQSAKVLGVIHEVASSPGDIMPTIDIVIFATPVNATLQWMDQLKTWITKPSLIVTDTGSTKKLIMDKALELKEWGITFIGGHPMAGSHKSGVLAAKPILFENAYYMLTPLQGTSLQPVEELKKLLQLTSAKLMVIDAVEHDQMTSVVSHFPHIVAASLVHQLANENEDHPFTKRLAAGGFRDITRIASSNPTMWTDITMQNRQQITQQLENWQVEMMRVKKIVQTGTKEDIQQFFAQAKSYRDELPSTSGALFTTYDLYIDVPDYPGSIAEITGYFAEEQISITNIRIVETREDIFGILVVSFTSIGDRQRAAECIRSRSPYEFYIS